MCHLTIVPCGIELGEYWPSLRSKPYGSLFSVTGAGADPTADVNAENQALVNPADAADQGSERRP